MKKNLLFFVSLSFLTTTLLLGNTFSFKAKADTSCAALLSDLSKFLQSSSSKRSITILHMTNYQTDLQKWWGGYTKTELQRSTNGHLTGKGSRLISSNSFPIGNPPTGIIFDGRPLQLFDIKKPDSISYDIDPQSRKITFGPYGPYDMTCIGTKFAIVNTQDSLETFTFFKNSEAPVLR